MNCTAGRQRCLFALIVCYYNLSFVNDINFMLLFSYRFRDYFKQALCCYDPVTNSHRVKGISFAEGEEETPRMRRFTVDLAECVTETAFCEQKDHKEKLCVRI